MNLPNKLSMIRAAMIPLCVALMYPGAYVCDWLALAVFSIAAFTDYLDGHIARKRNIVTNFGKFVDPVADKLLVISTLIMLAVAGKIAAWMVVAVLARELCVDGLRLVVLEQGRVIAASKLGKIKTASQIACIILLMLPVGLPAWLEQIVSWWMVAITLWSGVDYFQKNWRSLFPAKSGGQEKERQA